MDILQTLHLKVGGKVELHMSDKRVFATKIADATDKHLMITEPLDQGKPVAIAHGELLTVVYILETGRFGLPVKVISNKREGSAKLLVLNPTGPPRRQLLRGAYRLPASLSCVMFMDAPPANPLFQLGAQAGNVAENEKIEVKFTTQDISEGGLSFRTRTQYNVSEKVDIQVSLEWPTLRSAPLQISGEIKRCDPIKDNYFHVGIRFFKLNEETRKLLSRYILTKQQEILKRRRRVEDD